MHSIPSMGGSAFYQGLLEALARGMGSAKDYLVSHSPRAAVLAWGLGFRLGLPDEELARIFFGTMLSDLGMIGLAEEAWENAVPKLPTPVRAEVERHPVRSAQAAGTIPFLEGCGELIRHHHEWWDGSGYPDGLMGESIPFGSRLIRLADTVTALGEPRPHRRASSPREIRSLIAAGSGVEFDPRLVELWLALERRDDLPELTDPRYQEIRLHAVSTLVPTAVPLHSAGVLLELFSALIDAKDPYTAGHSRRVARLAGKVMEAMGRSEGDQDHARAAGYLHDLGKLSVPSRILRKPTPLLREEILRVHRHAEDGAFLLEGIPGLRSFAAACHHHHERWDGSGYPEGIRGEAIPIEARVLGICDAYDAMTSTRAYRCGLGRAAAMGEIAQHRGLQFAPREVDAFLSLPEELFEDLEEDWGNEFDLLAVSLYAAHPKRRPDPWAIGNPPLLRR